MIIQNYSGFKRMTALCKTKVPLYIQDDLGKIKENEQAVKDYGIQLAINMCQSLINRGISGFHFYTLNLERSTCLVLEGLGIGSSTPTIFAPHSFARQGNVSDLSRAVNWDEFTNGRWGDSRSPAFGNLDGYGVHFPYTYEQCIETWKRPESISEIALLFCDYITGKIARLPWSDEPLQPESILLQDRLINANLSHFFTINSQPALDGELSSDRVFGWGPKNGFVFQKEYLEFFISPAAMNLLCESIEHYPYMSYLASNENVSHTDIVFNHLG